MPTCRPRRTPPSTLWSGPTRLQIHQSQQPRNYRASAARRHLDRVAQLERRPRGIGTRQAVGVQLPAPQSCGRARVDHTRAGAMPRGVLADRCARAACLDIDRAVDGVDDTVGGVEMQALAFPESILEKGELHAVTFRETDSVRSP